MKFTDLELSPKTIERLAGRGITAPTPIQQEALPEALAGRDVLGLARTGTGKTLAFGLPIAERLGPSKERGRAPRALILAPTRELALQVAKELSWIAPHLKVVAVYGGTGYQAQARELKEGADVVVATPGRAVDYVRRGVLDLSNVEIAVLDEADEMLSMGFEEDVEYLLSKTPEDRQTLLFSATLPRWAERLVKRHLKDPKVANVVTDEKVRYTEEVYKTPSFAREAALANLIFAKNPARATVFVRTKAEADEVAEALRQSGLPAEAVHGDLGQRERERVIRAFREGRTKTLVATDVAARGLDIPEVDLVVHYRLPDKAESYQHRSGRTARAGKTGTVAILEGLREGFQVRRLEKAVGRRFKRLELPSSEAARTARLRALVEEARNQPEEKKAELREIAETWIKAGDVDALAGLLAMLIQPENPRTPARPKRRRVRR